MRAVIQRVSRASVSIDKKLINQINQGYMILLGVGQDDEYSDIQWLSKKIAKMRLFSDQDGKMNLDISQVNGEILLISQFTLYADTRRGNRPGFTEAAVPEIANEMYAKVAAELKTYNIPVKLGVFGGDMQVELINDGPCTIILDSKNRK